MKIKLQNNIQCFFIGFLIILLNHIVFSLFLIILADYFPFIKIFTERNPNLFIPPLVLSSLFLTIISLFIVFRYFVYIPRSANLLMLSIKIICSKIVIETFLAITIFFGSFYIFMFEQWHYWLSNLIFFVCVYFFCFNNQKKDQSGEIGGSSSEEITKDHPHHS